MRPTLALLVLMLVPAARAQSSVRIDTRLRTSLPDTVQVKALGEWPGASGDTAVLLTPIVRSGPPAAGTGVYAEGGVRLLRLGSHSRGVWIKEDIRLGDAAWVTEASIERDEDEGVVVASLGDARLLVARFTEDGEVTAARVDLPQTTRIHGAVPLGSGGLLVLGSTYGTNPYEMGQGFAGVVRDGAWARTELLPDADARWYEAHLAPTAGGGALALWERYVEGEPARTPLSLVRFGAEGAVEAAGAVGSHLNQAFDVVEDRGRAIVFAQGLSAAAAAVRPLPAYVAYGLVVARSGQQAGASTPAVRANVDGEPPANVLAGGVLGGALAWVTSRTVPEPYYRCTSYQGAPIQTVYGVYNTDDESPRDRLVGTSMLWASDYAVEDIMTTCTSVERRSVVELRVLGADNAVAVTQELGALLPADHVRTRQTAAGLRVEIIGSYGLGYPEPTLAVYDVTLR